MIKVTENEFIDLWTKIDNLQKDIYLCLDLDNKICNDIDIIKAEYEKLSR